MNLYNYLKEATTINAIRESIIRPIHEIQNLITYYLKVAETEKEHNELLGDIINELNKIVVILNDIGYDYQPENTPDVNEDTFRNTLDKFKDDLSRYLNNLNNDSLESFNAQIRYILNLIDVHRTNFIEEGEEVLTESSMKLNEALEVHEDLNPKLWHTDMTIKSEVRDALLKIADQFLEDIEIPLNIVDIEIVGSNASFNYNDKSDIDLHIIVNSAVNYVEPEILQQLYNLKKNSFNDHYDLSIEGIPVELYIEDVTSGNATNGRFSLTKNKWVKIPEPITYDIPDISKELAEYENKVNQLLQENDPDLILEFINDLYMMRKLGLAEEGEASVGNLIFKELRNKDAMTKLRDRYYELRSKELSI